MSDLYRGVRGLIDRRHRLPALRADGSRVSHDHDASHVSVFHRWVPGERREVIFALNLSEHTHFNYQLGFPPSPPLGERARGEVALEFPDGWEEAFNSDIYDHWVNPWRQGNGGGVFADAGPIHDFPQSGRVTLPANSICLCAS